jgi:hypothetical protein
MNVSVQLTGISIESALEESIMKHIQRAIVLSGLCLLLTVSSALAQSDLQTVVKIPFNFVVGEKTLPAGEYEIRRIKRDSDTAWVIKQKGNGASAVILTRPVQATRTQEENKLVFNQYDDLYFLSAIWTAGSNTGREIQISNRERAMDKALSMERQQYILTDRGR